MITLKVIAPICTALGSLLLAVRAKIFLDAYRKWHEISEFRIKQLEQEALAPQKILLNSKKGKEWFPKATKWAGALFWGGVALLVTGSTLSAISNWIR